MNTCPVPSNDNQSARLMLNSMSPARVLRIARGFSLIFWGVFLMAALFFGQAHLEIFQGIRIPAYVAGAGLIGCGLLLLQSAGFVRSNWRKRARLALSLSFLIIYFFPFLGWFRERPYETFFLLNVLALLLTGMSILLLVNLLAAEIIGLFEDRGGQVESQIFAFGVVILMIAPFLIGLLFALVASMRYHTLFAEEIMLTINRIPVWLYVAVTLPCSLTMVAAWKARDICYRRLWADGAKPETGRQTTNVG